MKSSPPRTTLEGRLERITYQHPSTHFTIAKLSAGAGQGLVTVVGRMPGVHPGEAMKVTGRWETHAKYGQQLKLESYEITLPATVEGIEKYLTSGVIKGIGPGMARRLVHHFGADTLKVFEETPEKLLEVRGIGAAKADAIASAWTDHHPVRELMQFLGSMGVRSSHVAGILKAYGSEAVKIIRDSPYRLANDVPGAGFHMADDIARKLGGGEDAPARIRAYVRFLLERAANDGHVYVHRESLVQECVKRIKVEEEAAREAVQRLAEGGRVAAEQWPDEDVAVHRVDLHEAEIGAAARLRALLTIPVAAPVERMEEIIERLQTSIALELSPEQLEALTEVVSHRVVVITGGPGTGKTTLIRSICALFRDLGLRTLLAAPTGRAARRLSEVTGLKAATIHRMLGWSLGQGAFEKDQDDPLDADAVIIDEASMVDIPLMHHFLKALPMTSRLILVGDVFQLPSVGPGNALADIIQSGKIRTFELTKIFRQALESPIVLNAHRVRQGEFPVFEPPLSPDDLSEFYYIQQSDPDVAAEMIVDLCRRRVPERFSLDPVRDIQVLTPMHKGPVGAIHLNRLLQKALNPDSDGGEKGVGPFKRGDKVMHLKNNYQKDVFNGDIGVIRRVDARKERLAVDFYGREVTYEFAELDQLTLAYAITVHKSQGSEYPAVIAPIMTQHYILLQRNLLYTAMTRGKKLVILIGTWRALEIALNNDKPRRRRTHLANRLAGGKAGKPDRNGDAR